jgi:galactokinase
MDWCGLYVMPAAIDARIFVEASPLPGHYVEVRSFKPFQTRAFFDLRNLRTEPSDLRYVGAVLKAVLLGKRITSENALAIKLLKGKDVAKDCGVIDGSGRSNDLPAKKGLSSSAALCIAIAAAADLITRASS